MTEKDGRLHMKPGARVVAESDGPPHAVRLRSARHHLVSDEPKALGGDDAGPPPFALLLAGLASCTAITLRMYAHRKEWPLEGVGVDLRYEETDGAVGIHRELSLRGPLDEAQRARLADIAERTPVTLALRAGTPVRTTLKPG
ncbi:OsmC family protein [Roseomonas sp. CCTCC AB2023176]|uniref:OsmC family protein n=1 Tax=Roseomonas sp. CCTCC AB2023176 TaxID=3342640 RepID=UPI0035DA02A8